MAWKPIFIMPIHHDVATVQHKFMNKTGLSAHGKPAGRIGKLKIVQQKQRCHLSRHLPKSKGGEGGNLLCEKHMLKQRKQQVDVTEAKEAGCFARIESEVEAKQKRIKSSCDGSKRGRMLGERALAKSKAKQERIEKAN